MASKRVSIKGAKRAGAEQVQAGELKKGDSIYFPNSRKPQEITKIEKTDDEDVRLCAGESLVWLVPPTFRVDKVVSE